MNSGRPTPPANAAAIVEINQGRRPLTMELPSARPLTAEKFQAEIDGGALSVDTRSTAEFARRHIPDSLHVHLSSSQFEQRIGWLAAGDESILLVLSDDEDAERALRALAFLGLDVRVSGYLQGGLDAWVSAGRDVDSIPQIGVEELNRRLSAGHTLRILDVREQEEWAQGSLAGAHQMSYRDLRRRLDELSLEAEDEIAVVCAGGGRSSTACSVLRRAGYARVCNVTGGMSAWRRAGLPVSGDHR